MEDNVFTIRSAKQSAMTKREVVKRSAGCIQLENQIMRFKNQLNHFDKQRACVDEQACVDARPPIGTRRVKKNEEMKKCVPRNE